MPRSDRQLAASTKVPRFAEPTSPLQPGNLVYFFIISASRRDPKRSAGVYPPQQCLEMGMTPLGYHDLFCRLPCFKAKVAGGKSGGFGGVSRGMNDDESGPSRGSRAGWLSEHAGNPGLNEAAGVPGESAMGF